MQNVYDIAHELVRSLKETDQYINYKKAKAKVDAEESLAKMINDFQAKNIEFQRKAMSGQAPTEEEIQQIQSLYGIVSQDPTCQEYLSTQMQLSTVLNDIFKIIGEGADIE